MVGIDPRRTIDEPPSSKDQLQATHSNVTAASGLDQERGIDTPYYHIYTEHYSVFLGYGLKQMHKSSSACSSLDYLLVDILS
jgi:hypothetical protein